MKKFVKQSVCGLLAVIMLVTALPFQSLAQVNYDQTSIKSQQDLNKTPLTVTQAMGKAAEEIVKNPAMPKLYTMRADYKVPRNDEEIVGYQPYIATVGDEDYTYTDLDGNGGKKVLTGEEKSNIKKEINLPAIDGYTSPTKSFTVNYDYIKENAKKGNLDGDEYKGQHPYLYKAKQGTIKIKHTFQKLENRDEYGVKDGDTDFIYTSQTGVTGTSVTIKALDGERIKGYEAEVNVLTTQVPQNSAAFEIEMRYNRAIFDVNFDSNGGTDLPGMTLIYGQTIPKLNFDIKKLGSNLQGWKVNKDINYLDAEGNKKTLTTDTLITKKDFEPGGKFESGIKNAMPAEGLTFTAQWTEKDKAEYVIQFWSEKPDYNDQDDTLSLRDRYDFIGARRIDNADTGSTLELTNLDIHGITFPDLNDGRLEKAQDNKEEFARYYFLNEDLTKKQNASEDNPEVQKSVSATGETIYNVYYDRRVYTLYFTKHYETTDLGVGTFYPTITRNGKVIGEEGNPYKVDVRFNQSLDKIWPKDEEVTGLPTEWDEDISSEDGDSGLIGWLVNTNTESTDIFRDTPPYRLSAEDFIDNEDILGEGEIEGGYDYKGEGHSTKIPIGKDETKDREKYEISLGVPSSPGSIVHHIDFIKDDFEGKEQIDYGMSYWKSDTTNNYDFALPHLQGFTLKQDRREAEWIFTKKFYRSDKTFDELNAERKAKTPFRSGADKIEYIDKFPWGTKSFEGRNAYNYARYSRNKYKLKLNNDPKTVKNDSEYGAGNILDVPYELPLKNLKLDTKHAPERPDWVPEDWSFLGWALDPAGDNLVKDGNETKLHYDQVLYAKWGEPETIWKVKFDPNGGTLRDLSTNNISDKSKKLEIDGEVHTYPEKIAENTPNFVHKMILKEPKDGVKNVIEPTRPGYNFAGWEFVRYTKDKDGNDTEAVDTSYKDLYKVPEMYHFGNEVVGNVHLRAIWNKQDLITVKAIHHFLDGEYNEKSNEVQNLYNRRVGSYTTGLASRQGDKYLLVPQAEWDALYNANTDYKKYKDETGRENSYNQILRVEAEKVHDPDTGELIDNPNFAKNRFEFFYKPFKERVYEVNYLDERGKEDVEAFMEKAKTAYKAIKDNADMSSEDKSAAYKDLLANNREEFAKIKEKYAVIPNETVVNGKRHYDARNYRKIPGWVLNDKPQQQLFFDIYEDTDTFAGINETGLDEINFFYKDVRVIEVKDPDEKVPDGYKRVTFVAEEGGNFTGDKNNEVKKLYYDVIVGLKSDNLPVPGEVKEDEEKVEGKYYITPDAGKKFIKWDKEKLLNSNTIIDKNYTFTAYFDWSGVKVNELVRTESYKDPQGNWINNFAPTIEELKALVKWVDKDGNEGKLPADATVTIVDNAGNPLSEEAIYEKVKELGKFDSDELVRTVKFKAKVKFADNSVQEIEIPVKIYKNVYEGLTTGTMPKILKDATSAPDGDLVKVTGDYVKVTVNPTGEPGNKDSKIYYVNPKAWVEIPEIKLTEEEKKELGFTHWSADAEEQNENGVYDFAKRHKFTEDTVISPGFTKDVVEQTDPDKKPPVPDTFVKVVVKTSEDGIEKATDNTKFERTFWVNPTKVVTIPVDNPVGDLVKDDKGNIVTDAAGNGIKWTFKEWSSSLTANFTEKETIITAKYEKTISEPTFDASIVETYVGREPELSDYEKSIKMILGETDLSFDKNVSSFEIIQDPDVSKKGMTEAKVKVEFNNGQVKEVTVPVKVYDNIYPADTNGEKTSETPENYVKVTVNPKAYNEDNQQIKYYYVNPKVKVLIPELVISNSDKEEYGFKKWTTNNKDINALDPKEAYDFTKEYQFTADTEIYAFYEKNGDPEIQINFETEEIVKNIGDEVSNQEYKDALIIPKNADGTPIADVKAINVKESADTSKAGYTSAKIEVVYDEGKTQELIVLVKVLPDYVEQKDGEDKPAVPDNFVEVIVDKTEKAQLQPGEQQSQTFWVNPEKEVTIPVTNPVGKVGKNSQGETVQWKFTKWDKSLTGTFTELTTITAQYEPEALVPGSVGYIVTEEGVQPTTDQYKGQLTPPEGKTIDKVEVLTPPDVTKPGARTAKLKVIYEDGTSSEVNMTVFVQRKASSGSEGTLQPLRPSGTVTVVEKEIVEVPVKDRNFRKEVWYMQGFADYFRPTEGLTRAEAAQILANALVEDGYKFNPNYALSYKDITGNEWYAKAIRITTQADVFRGYDTGYFDPHKKITRGEWIATLRRFQELDTEAGNHMGVRADHWGIGEIEAAYKAGWLTLYDQGLAKFKVDEFIPRQEVAAVSNKAFNRVLDKTYIQRNSKNLISYKDINPSMWSYEDILCASNTFLHRDKLYRGHAMDRTKTTYNIDLAGYTVTQDKFQRIERR